MRKTLLFLVFLVLWAAQDAGAVLVSGAGDSAADSSRIVAAADAKKTKKELSKGSPEEGAKGGSMQMTLKMKSNVKPKRAQESGTDKTRETRESSGWVESSRVHPDAVKPEGTSPVVKTVGAKPEDEKSPLKFTLHPKNKPSTSSANTPVSGSKGGAIRVQRKLSVAG